MARQRPVREAEQLRLGDDVDNAAGRDGPQARLPDQKQRGRSLGDRSASREHVDPGSDLRLPAPKRGNSEFERPLPGSEGGFVDVARVRRRPVLAEGGTDLGVGELRFASLLTEELGPPQSVRAIVFAALHFR